MATSERMKRHANDQKRAIQKIHGLEKELKKARSELDNARNAAEIAIEKRNKALQEVDELQKVACGAVYRRVFDHAYNWLGDAYEK